LNVDRGEVFTPPTMVKELFSVGKHEREKVYRAEKIVDKLLNK